MQKSILVTGGLGYIGSHTVVELLNSGCDVVVVDDLSNSSPLVKDRIESICGKKFKFIEGDICSKSLLDEIFSEHNIDAVIHFAGLKAVGESVEKPILYYRCNVLGSLNLIESMNDAACHKLVFSSSATVYGDPASLPIKEEANLSATNPYGQSKLMIEIILRDLCASDNRWNVTLLRYFNPVSAHPSGLIGEDPNGLPNNLLPFISQVAIGKLEELVIHGDDYETKDGTGVRDYIHVVDLADAHIAALKHLGKHRSCATYNIGTGNGYSVMEMIKAFEVASGVSIPYKVGPRREGDIASCYACADLAAKELAWSSAANLEKMMSDLWRWQSNNPRGYETS